MSLKIFGFRLYELSGIDIKNIIVFVIVISVFYYYPRAFKLYAEFRMFFCEIIYFVYTDGSYIPRNFPLRNYEIGRASCRERV